MMSGQASVDAAVKATRLGALDFVEKPVGLDRLLLTLKNALKLVRLERENRELQRYWRDELQLVGESAVVSALRGLIERALILSAADPLDAADLQLALPAAANPAAPARRCEGSLHDLIEAFERDVVRERLRASGGNVASAARSLGLERSHLYKKCRQLGLELREDADAPERR